MRPATHKSTAISTNNYKGMIKQPHKLSPAVLLQVWAWANLRVDALSWACLGRADCCCLLVSCTPGGLLRASDILTSRPSQASLRPAHVRRRHAAPGLRRVGCWCSLCAHEPRLVLALAPNLGSCTDNKNRQGSSTNRIVPSKLWSKLLPQNMMNRSETPAIDAPQQVLTDLGVDSKRLK